MLLVVVEHASVIAPTLKITYSIAADRLTITSASIVGMSAALASGVQLTDFAIWTTS